ncbi:alpha/beta-hydrolase, partial [Agrocybe pediades]
MLKSLKTQPWLLLLATSSCVSAQNSTNTLSPVVDLGHAKYQGVLVQDVLTNATNTQFLGIRYAAPPTGTLRFAAPSPPSPTPAAQTADTQPSICFQANGLGLSSSSPFSQLHNNATSTNPQQRRDVLAAVPAASEDCLFLDVVVPGKLGGSNDGLPVVVWIHGGGYTSGSASAMIFSPDSYDGNDLVRESGGDVIVVLIQYRLGLFGFLAGQNVKDGGALNAGLLDQRMALQWVQTNIKKFGGDPSRVTIWGQSAGAGSVLQHIIADNGNTSPPLFQSAITSSTFLPSQYRFNDTVPELLYNETVSRANCSSQADTLGCLRQADASALATANNDILDSGFSGTFAFVPVVDGTLITDSPINLLKQGKVNGKALYSVTNSFEGNDFVDQGTAATVQVENYVAQLLPTVGPQVVEAATQQYAGLGSNISQVNAIMGESIFICPTYYLFNAFKNKTFKAQFAVPPALHGNDLPYYFDNGQIPLTGKTTDFANAFSESFLNFVKTLNPGQQTNITGLPTNISLSSWKMWNGTNEMLFNVTADGAPDVRAVQTPQDLLNRCAFWETVDVAGNSTGSGGLVGNNSTSGAGAGQSGSNGTSSSGNSGAGASLSMDSAWK